jgi:hypothetical protein
MTKIDHNELFNSIVEDPAKQAIAKEICAEYLRSLGITAPKPPEVVAAMFRFNSAVAAHRAINDELIAARKALCSVILDDHPPLRFRLQEAYRNEDGTHDAPHWDETAEYRTQNLIDYEELVGLILSEGQWSPITDAGCAGKGEDQRGLSRRVIEVQWS